MYRLLTTIALVASVAWLIIAPSFEPFVACVLSFAAVFRDEWHAVVGTRIFSLTPRTRPLKSLAHARYSFARSEFVNPMIVADINGWISDVGDQIVAINVSDSNRSNRYHSAMTISAEDGHPIVSAEFEGERFSYQYLGRSFTGVHLLRIWSSGGGSGVFCSLMLLTLSAEPGIDISVDRVMKTERFIAKKIASMPLGDRYGGVVSYRFGVLTIGACPGLKALRTKKQRLLII
jgi:hypothetical protein